ncbi:MAG: putative quinol monooxygenase [Quisquiliibacterium sp.]
MSYVVIAEFKVQPGAVEQFRELMTRHAHRSVTTEDGCFQFDVCQVLDDPTRFVLYERYANEAAYLEHRADPRHPQIIDQITPLVVARQGNIFWNRTVAGQVSFKV